MAAELREPDAFAYVLLAVYSLTPILRRRSPVVAVLGGLAAGLVYAGAVSGGVDTGGAAVDLHGGVGAAAATGTPAVGRIGGGRDHRRDASPGPTDPGVPALIVSAWLLGNYIGSRRRYTAELEAKNQLLGVARVELADRAVTEERLRIARELHDVVAHTMSVVAVQAGTGRMVADDDPAAARQALATIEITRARRCRDAADARHAAQLGRRRPGDVDTRPGWGTSMRWSLT